jgi:RNA polymerase sigma-70 factor (ECF subfamily)
MALPQPGADSNRAVSAGLRERRSVPVDDLEPVVDASRFDPGGTWRVPPEPWTDQADDTVIAAKISARILTAIEDLPPRQRQVATRRDVQGLSGEEVCAVLDIGQANQRVLLDRGRSRLRQRRAASTAPNTSPRSEPSSR